MSSDWEWLNWCGILLVKILYGICLCVFSFFFTIVVFSYVGKRKKYKTNIFNIEHFVLVFHRLQLFLQRRPLFQIGRHQPKDCEVGWNHKGLAWLLSTAGISGSWLFLWWPLASWGQCVWHSGQHTTHCCRVLAWQLCTLSWVTCPIQPL